MTDFSRTVKFKMAKHLLTINSEELAMGLRPSIRSPRNKSYLEYCYGAVGRDEVLQSLSEITRIATTAITDDFPYPQIFTFKQVIIVCGSTKICEWVSGALVLKRTASQSGGTWTALDFNNYIYLSNGEVVVVRSPTTQAYSETTDIPTSMSSCDYNGQVLLGSPDAGHGV